MSPMWKQFWFFGAVPLTFIYVVTVIIISIEWISTFPDCVMMEVSCPNGEKAINTGLPLPLIGIMGGLTAFNVFRVFQLSKMETNRRQKILAKASVIFFPALAIALAVPLTLLTIRLLTPIVVP